MKMNVEDGIDEKKIEKKYGVARSLLRKWRSLWKNGKLIEKREGHSHVCQQQRRKNWRCSSKKETK